jgi:sugar lactone lactonase YvrE
MSDRAISAPLTLGFVFFFVILFLPSPPKAFGATLFEADFTSGIIYRFSPDGSRTVYTAGLNGPEGLAFDIAGNCFVSEALGNSIHKFGTDGSDTVFASGLNGPASLVFDGTGNLYSADFFGGFIYKFDPNGARTTFASGLNGPANLIFDGMGRLLATDFHSGNVFRFTPDGTRTTFASGVGNPHGLAFDANGDLFVADFAGGTILRFTPAGMRSTFASGLDGPHGLVFDQSGNLFSADYNTGNVYQFTPGGARSTFASGLNNPGNLLFEPVRPSANNLLNLSTRAFVGTNTGVLIGGLILQGTAPATLVLRAIGPSLTPFGINGALADPSLELHDSSGALLASNDNWQTGPDASAIQRVGLVPNDANESALRATVPAGAYTVIISGVNQSSGIGVVEIYDLHQTTTRAGNIATRGTVLSGENVMIAGCIIGGSASKTLVVRAIGPSLFNFGVPDALGNPHLGFFNANGVLVSSNEDWQQGPDATAIQNLNLAPGSPLEAAVLVTLTPGAYTGIESPAAQDSGVGLIEIYDVSPAP